MGLIAASVVGVGIGSVIGVVRQLAECALTLVRIDVRRVAAVIIIYVFDSFKVIVVILAGIPSISAG